MSTKQPWRRIAAQHPNPGNAASCEMQDCADPLFVTSCSEAEHYSADRESQRSPISSETCQRWNVPMLFGSVFCALAYDESGGCRDTQTSVSPTLCR